MSKLIRVSRPEIGRGEIEEVVESLRSGWLTAGPKAARFEKDLANYLGVRNVVLTSSCTAAFHLLLLALGVGPGDEVITPSLTYPSLGNVLLHLGARPVFVDINPDSLTVDVADIRRKISRKTRAIVPVDYAGLPCDLSEIKKLVKGTKIQVIEDAATSFGASYRGKKVGAVADFTCFSFYATKNITTGEGGALATNNNQVAEKVRLLSKLGVSASAWKRHRNRSSWYFQVIALGLKYYMTDLQAAIGLHQLKKIDTFVKRRRKIAQTYYEKLAGVGIIASPYPEFPKDHVWNFYPVLVKKGVDRNRLMKEMEKLGVASSVYYIPMHTHPLFRKLAHQNLRLPVTEEVFSRVASLPLYPGLTAGEVHQVIDVVKRLDRRFLG